MSAGTECSTIVTTSWDDGDPLDLKVAEMLRTAGVAGTFYVPLRGSAGRRVMTPAELRELHSLGMEIGGHTVNHVDVTRLSRAELRRELSDSKQRLEQIVQEPVTSFCYPNGSFSAGAATAVAECGYEVGRTTVAFRTGTRFDPLRMPVTFQVFPHKRSTHVRHALKERNLSGLSSWIGALGGSRSLSRLTDRVLARVLSAGGVLHLWGHSWELEEQRLWSLTRTLIDQLAGHGPVDYLTNGEVGRFVRSQGMATP